MRIGMNSDFNKITILTVCICSEIFYFASDVGNREKILEEADMAI